MWLLQKSRFQDYGIFETMSFNPIAKTFLVKALTTIAGKMCSKKVGWDDLDGDVILRGYCRYTVETGLLEEMDHLKRIFFSRLPKSLRSSPSPAKATSARRSTLCASRWKRTAPSKASIPVFRPLSTMRFPE